MADLVGAATRPRSAGAGAGAAYGGGGLRLTLARSNQEVHVHPVLFRASSEQVMLCRLEPAGTAGRERAISADDRARDLAGLFDLGADAIVTTDAAGAIRFANEAFLNLTDGTDQRSVVGRLLSDFLSRGGVDLKVLLDGARQASRVRLYPTRLVSEYGSQRPVTIAVTHLTGRDSPGYAFVLRDAGQSMTETAAPGWTPAAARPVDELVGGTPMKEIVAQTADVVERMCIETAIEMTGNNRVAAAGLLGVSRQSLYVKLRKYGLVEWDGETAPDELST
jgi:transcriptional regulator PpsR